LSSTPSPADFYRFPGGGTVSIAEQLDGETPLDVHSGADRKNSSARRSAPTRLKALRPIISTRSACWDTGKPRRQGAIPAGAGGFAANLLYLRLALLDPDRPADTGWCRGCGSFFTRRFMGVVGPADSARARDHVRETPARIADDLPRLYQAVGDPAVPRAHFGRGVHSRVRGTGWACKYFRGGRLHELGFMVMYFQPAVLLQRQRTPGSSPRKSKRLWVGFRRTVPGAGALGVGDHRPGASRSRTPGSTTRR